MLYLFVDASQNKTYVQAGSKAEYSSNWFDTDRDLSARIVELCETTLKKHGTKEQIDLFGFCSGPGGLTGLRAAAAFMRGSALVTGKKAFCISLFDWAFKTLKQNGAGDNFRMVVPTLIDKAFEVRVTDGNVCAPALIERKFCKQQSDCTYSIRSSFENTIFCEPTPQNLHEIITTDAEKYSADFDNILRLLPLYIIPSQAERKLEEKA